MDVLQLDVSGRPQAWMTVKEAAVLYACDAVAWTLGDPCHVMRGGTQRATEDGADPAGAHDADAETARPLLCHPGPLSFSLRG